MISSIHAAARYLPETNEDRFSSVMRQSDLVGLTVNISPTFSIAGDSTVFVSHMWKVAHHPMRSKLAYQTCYMSTIRFTLSAYENFFAKFINNNLTFPLDFKYSSTMIVKIIFRLWCYVSSISFKTEPIELKK